MCTMRILKPRGATILGEISYLETSLFANVQVKQYKFYYFFINEEV